MKFKRQINKLVNKYMRYTLSDGFDCILFIFYKTTTYKKNIQIKYLSFT
jgi:hypothetical protein